MKRSSDRAHKAFLNGMICALAVVYTHDEETVWREIVLTQGDAELRAHARRTGALRWAGFSRYKRQK